MELGGHQQAENTLKEIGAASGMEMQQMVVEMENQRLPGQCEARDAYFLPAPCADYSSSHRQRPGARRNGIHP